MGKFQDTLVAIGAKLSDNKYLGSVRDAFVALIPFTIIGSMAVLWSNVIVNDSTGLGALWAPIMALSFLNPIFDALNFCTLGCVSVIIAFMVGMKLANRYEDMDNLYGGVIGVVSFIVVLQSSQTIGEESVSGLFSDSLGSNGLFTGMLMAILGVEVYHWIHTNDHLRIKMPAAVPPSIAKSFDLLIPAALTLIAISTLSLIVRTVSGGLYVNEVIATMVQAPLTKVGGSFGGFMLVQLVVLVLWSIGLHGDNMVQGIMDPIKYALTIENMNLITNGQEAVNFVNNGSARAFFATGGTGMVLGLTIAMLIAAKREDNRSIAKMTLVPNLFNIGEVDMFGFPVVLNPTLMIPFIVAPLVSGTIGYVATMIGFCPIFAYDVPWTMPPILIAFVATGGSIAAVITQAVCIAVSVLIYLPFVRIHEKAQEVAEKADPTNPANAEDDDEDW